MRNTIKVFRAMNNLSQDDLAKKLEVSRQTIINIEKDKTEPSIKLALKMAKILGAKIEELFLAD
ncbi:MAG: helix-turn-helix transcriptional regulator [Candidatus Diapherotrites archaeon]